MVELNNGAVAKQMVSLSACVLFLVCLFVQSGFYFLLYVATTAISVHTYIVCKQLKLQTSSSPRMEENDDRRRWC